MVRSLFIYADKAFVSTSIEGRIAYDLLSASQQHRNYAFRAHRVENPNTKVNTVYPVNTISFHPVHGTFASGGGDGSIAIWDPVVRKRIKYYAPEFGGSIASLAFSADGRWMGLAVSMGDDGSGTVEGRGGGRIVIKELAENEGKRKA
jgi:cell cycle arrest protein BUB3